MRQILLCIVLSCVLILEQIGPCLTSHSKSQKRRRNTQGEGEPFELFPAQTADTNGLDYDDDTSNDFESSDEIRDGLKSKDRRTRSLRHIDDEDDYDEEKQLEKERKKRKPAGREESAKDSINKPEGYSIFEIPKDNEGNPIPLYVHVTIVNILDLAEMDEMLHMDILFSVMWTDYKILYYNNKSAKPNISLPTIETLSPDEIRRTKKTLNNPNILDSIWKPNLFIEHLLSVKQPAVMARPLTIKYIPHVGWFEYTTRISVKLDCEMDFLYYPADTQTCDFSIRGFSYSQKDIRLHWFRSGVFLDDITLPSFDVRIEWIDKVDWSVDKHSKSPEEIFDVLKFRISARRKLSYHVVQTYMASTFYIIITTLCFLLPSRMIEARIGISMTTLLTLTAMFASVRESTPIVSYVKAIDTWMVGCIFFVFLTLSQFTFLTWLKGDQDEDEEKAKKRKNSIGNTDEREALNRDGVEMLELTTSAYGKRLSQTDVGGDGSYVLKLKSKRRSERMTYITEKYSFPFFLSIFAIYTIIYWSWLLSSADYFDWYVNGTWNNLEEEVD